MGFLLTQRHGNTHNLAFASLVDPDGQQHGCIPDLSFLAHLFLAGIQVQVYKLA